MDKRVLTGNVEYDLNRFLLSDGSVCAQHECYRNKQLVHTMKVNQKKKHRASKSRLCIGIFSIDIQHPTAAKCSGRQAIIQPSPCKAISTSFFLSASNRPHSGWNGLYAG